uniref:Uncharacterized protein n=1 Tax=Biomphalaria glabrata TaxID=6526 RepID=A0A2C9LLP8_BIOGL
MNDNANEDIYSLNSDVTRKLTKRLNLNKLNFTVRHSTDHYCTIDRLSNCKAPEDDSQVVTTVSKLKNIIRESESEYHTHNNITPKVQRSVSKPLPERPLSFCELIAPSSKDLIKETDKIFSEDVDNVTFGMEDSNIYESIVELKESLAISTISQY